MIDEPRQSPGDLPDWSGVPDPWERSGAGSLPILPKARPAANRAVVQRRRWIALALTALWCSLAVLVRFPPRADWPAVLPFLAGQSGVWLAAATVTSALALASGARGVGLGSAALRAGAVCIPLAFVVLALVWTPPGGAPWRIGDARALAPCVALGLAMAVPTLALATWAASRAFVARSALRGAALGVASGLIGAVVLVVHCANGGGGHVAIAHGLPVLAGCMLGALAGQRLMRA